jgi:carboxyl-terminal processing protease
VFNGRVAMLIDARTFSAAEDTAAIFRLMKRGIIVGMPSGGSTGQPWFFNLPGGGQARICIKRDSYPDGTSFVGTGIVPDIQVSATIAGIRAGADPVIDRAARELIQAEPVRPN